jgi:Tfp pilus assembly protein PilF
VNVNRFGRFLPALFVFIVAFGVYVYTLCPTVYWDDAGELIVACYTLGIPHPPGHPLYAIIGKLFTLVPLGSPAFRVNLMSAFFGALTCVMLFQVVRELIRAEEQIRAYADFAGVSAALCAAFSVSLWDQSVVAETTTLHSFFMMAVTLLAFRIDATASGDTSLTRRLLALSFIFGLSFTNHVAGLFFVPSLAFILIHRLRLGVFRPSRLLAMLLLFALGLLVYLYLPVRSRFDPPIDWGNPETMNNFLWVVTARQYSSNLWRVPSLVAFLRGLSDVLKTFLSDLTWLGCAFALVGALRLWRARKPVLVYGIIVMLILFFISLNSAYISVYLVPAVLMLAIWAGFGIAFLCHQARHVTSNLSGFRKGLLGRSSHVVAVSLVLILLFVHFPMTNKRQHVYPKEYGVSLLSPLPENAILITGSADPLFICWYLQYCEGYRTDVKVITRNGMIRPGYLEQIRRQYPDLNIPVEFRYEDDTSVRPSYIHERGTGLPWYVNSYFKRLYDLNVPEFSMFWEGIESNQLLMERFVPHKLVFQILPPGQDPDSVPCEIMSTAEIEERIGHDLAAGRIYGNHLFSYAVYYQWHNDRGAAERYYRDALKLYPRDARALNNIGALLAESGKDDEAFEKFLLAFRLGPDDPTSNHNVGQMLLNRGEVRKAIPYFRRAIASDTPGFEDYHSLGLCWADLGKNKQAVEMFKKALLLKPDSPEALSSLGVAYLRLKETQNAAKLLKMAVELEPGSVENWYNFACLQALEGNVSGSTESLRKALSLNYQKAYALASKDPEMVPILDSLLDKPLD